MFGFEDYGIPRAGLGGRRMHRDRSSEPFLTASNRCDA